MNIVELRERCLDKSLSIEEREKALTALIIALTSVPRNYDRQKKRGDPD